VEDFCEFDVRSIGKCRVVFEDRSEGFDRDFGQRLNEQDEMRVAGVSDLGVAKESRDVDIGDGNIAAEAGGPVLVRAKESGWRKGDANAAAQSFPRIHSEHFGIESPGPHFEGHEWRCEAIFMEPESHAAKCITTE
jgi:hypothetical protein